MIVVDASVLISALLPQDINHTTSKQWLQSQSASQSRLIVPAILPAEITGPIAHRTGDAKLAHRALQFVTALPTLQIVTVDRHVGGNAATIAANYKLRGADAIYVAIAFQMQIPLVTWDKQQRTRASQIITSMLPAI